MQYCKSHAFEVAKEKAEKKWKQKKIKPIPKFSEKRKRESYLYSRKRKTFLAKDENKICPVAKDIFNETCLATEIHHKAGRIGKLLNYVPHWLAVSRKGHEWIHQNPSEAYKRGYLIHSSSV